MQLNDFQQSEIKQKLSSIQKITCISAIAYKKIKSVLWRTAHENRYVTHL